MKNLTNNHQQEIKDNIRKGFVGEEIEKGRKSGGAVDGREIDKHYKKVGLTPEEEKEFEIVHQANIKSGVGNWTHKGAKEWHRRSFHAKLYSQKKWSKEGALNPNHPSYIKPENNNLIKKDSLHKRTLKP